MNLKSNPFYQIPYLTNHPRVTAPKQRIGQEGRNLLLKTTLRNFTQNMCSQRRAPVDTPLLLFSKEGFQLVNIGRSSRQERQFGGGPHCASCRSYSHVILLMKLQNMNIYYKIDGSPEQIYDWLILMNESLGVYENDQQSNSVIARNISSSRGGPEGASGFVKLLRTKRYYFR